MACAGIVALGDAAYTQTNRLEDIEDVLHQVSAIPHRIVRRLSLLTVEIDSQDPTAEDLHCAALFCCADIIDFIAFAIGERKANVLSIDRFFFRLIEIREIRKYHNQAEPIHKGERRYIELRRKISRLSAGPYCLRSLFIEESPRPFNQCAYGPQASR